MVEVAFDRLNQQALGDPGRQDPYDLSERVAKRYGVFA
jgi:hypothetical protein